MVGDDVFHYLIDVETKQQLSSNKEILPRNVLNLYKSQPMMVTHTNISEKEGVFICEHCDNFHSHDTIIFVPAVNRSYYTSQTDIKLV